MPPKHLQGINHHPMLSEYWRFPNLLDKYPAKLTMCNNTFVHHDWVRDLELVLSLDPGKVNMVLGGYGAPTIEY